MSNSASLTIKALRATPTLAVKVTQKNKVALKVLPRFPAAITALSPIVLTRLGNGVQISFDATQLTFPQSGIGVTLDGGGGAAILTGYQLSLPVPFNCTITASTLLADAAGTIQMDIKKASLGGFPAAVSIVGASPPTLGGGAQSVKDSVLTGWSVTLLQGDILEFWVTSATIVSKVTLALDVTRNL